MADNQKLAIELQDVLNGLRRSHVFEHGQSCLKGAEKQVLFKVAKLNNGKPVTTSEISSKLGVTLAAITHQINSLEKQGYIVRVQNKDDRRVVSLSLSKKGQDVIRILQKEFSKKVRILADYLGEEDAKDLIRILKKISEIVPNSKGERNA